MPGTEPCLFNSLPSPETHRVPHEISKIVRFLPPFINDRLGLSKSCLECRSVGGFSDSQYERSERRFYLIGRPSL